MQLPEFLFRQPTYMGLGTPAFATVTFKNGKEPATGATVVVNGTTFTYGQDWKARPVNVSQAKAFSDMINGSPESDSTKAASNYLFAIYAFAIQNICYLVARVPGTAGNSFTLTRTDANAIITISGATFSGGTAAVAGGGGASAPQQAIVSAGQSPTLDAAFGTVTTHVSKASAAQLLSVYATSANASARFFQLFNRATALAGGETPIYSFPVGSGASAQPAGVVLDSTFFTLPGVNFATGLTWAFSSVGATYSATNVTAADHFVHVHFV